MSTWRRSAERLRWARRRIAETWPDTPAKAIVLGVLDEMVFELDEPVRR